MVKPQHSQPYSWSNTSTLNITDGQTPALTTSRYSWSSRSTLNLTVGQIPAFSTLQLVIFPTFSNRTAGQIPRTLKPYSWSNSQHSQTIHLVKSPALSTLQLVKHQHSQPYSWSNPSTLNLTVGQISALSTPRYSWSNPDILKLTFGYLVQLFGRPHRQHDNIGLFIVHAKIMHGNLPLVCTL